MSGNGKKITLGFYDDPPLANLGYSKASLHMYTRFSWHKMGAYIRRYIEACLSCQRRKLSDHSRFDGLGTWVDYPPQQTWAIDFTGPFPQSNNGIRYVCIAVDLGCRYVTAKAIPAIESWATVKFVKKSIIHPKIWILGVRCHESMN